MTCDNCKKNPAEVFLTQIVDGKMQKVNLCKTCSKEKGVDDPTGFALADLLLGVGENTQIAPSHEEAVGNVGKDANLKCPACGFTQNDFKKTGRLGCSECYDTFAPTLNALLKAMHKGISHIGKTPAHAQEREQHNVQIKALRDDLEKAVQSERYEDAAQLRDKLRQIESEIGN